MRLADTLPLKLGIADAVLTALEGEAERLVVEGKGADVHIESYPVGMLVDTRLTEAWLRDVSMPEGCADIVSSVEEPIRIKVTTPGRATGVPNLRWAAHLSIEARGPNVCFYFPQFDSMLDFFKTGYIHRLLSVTDMYLDPPPQSSGPPEVSLQLHDVAARLPTDTSCDDGLAVNLEKLALCTTMHSDTTASTIVTWNNIKLAFTNITVLSDVKILQETSFDLLISNVLAIDDVFQKNAGLKVTLQAPSLDIRLTHDDYLSVLSVFCLNLLGVPPEPGLRHHEPKDISLCFEDIKIALPSYDIRGKQLRPLIRSDTFGDKQIDLTLHELSIFDDTRKALLNCCSEAQVQDDFIAVSIKTQNGDVKHCGVHLDTLKWTIVPHAWRELHEFFADTDSINVLSSVTKLSQTIQKAQTQQVSEGTTVAFNCAQFTVTLLNALDTTDLMSVNACDFNLNLNKTPTTMCVAASLARLYATDSRPFSHPSDRYTHVLDTARSDKLVSIAYTSYAEGTETGYLPPGHTTLIHSSDVTAKLGEFLVVYKHVFWNEVAASIMSSPVHRIMEKGKETAARATHGVHKGIVSKVDVTWDSPTVVIPADYGSEDCLRLKLKNVSVRSSVKEDNAVVSDCMDVAFTSLSLSAQHDGHLSEMLHDTTGCLAVSRVVVTNNETPNLTLRTSLPPFTLYISPPTWSFLKQIGKHNVNEALAPTSPLLAPTPIQTPLDAVDFVDAEPPPEHTDITVDATCPSIRVVLTVNGSEALSMSMETLAASVKKVRGDTGKMEACIEVGVLSVKDLQGEAPHILKPADNTKASLVTRIYSEAASKPKTEVSLAPLVMCLYPKRLNELLQHIPQDDDNNTDFPLLLSPSFSRQESFLRPSLSSKHGTLTVKVACILINLLETPDSTLAKIKVGECSATCIQANRIRVVGNLGNVQVFDEETSAEILGLAKPEEGSVISFAYESMNSRMYTHKVSITLHSVRFLVLATFIQRLQSVIEGHVAVAVKETQTIITHEARAAAVSAVCLSLRIEHPVIIVPDKSDSSSYISVDLGLMTFENYLEEGSDCLTAAVDNCHISCVVKGDEISMLDSPLHARASGKRSLCHSSIDTTVNISPLTMKLSQDVWHECVTVLCYNVMQLTKAKQTKAPDQQPTAETEQKPLTLSCAVKCPVVSITAEIPVDSLAPLLLRTSASGVSASWHSTPEHGRFEVTSISITGGAEGCEVDEVLHVNNLVATTATEQAASEDVTCVQVAAKANFSVVPSMWLQITDFVIAPFERVTRGLPADMSEVNVITINDNITLTSDLELGEHTMLHITSAKNTVTIKGNGHMVSLVKMRDKKRQPIHVDDGVVLVVVQCVFMLSHESSLHDYVSLGGPSAGLLADPLRNKFQVSEAVKQDEENVHAVTRGGSCKIVKLEADLALRGKLSDGGGRALVMGLDVHSDVSRRLASDGRALQTFGNVMVSKLEVLREDQSAYLVERVRLDAFVKGTSSIAAIEVMTSNISIRVAHSDVVFMVSVLTALNSRGPTTRPYVKKTHRENIEVDIKTPVIELCTVDDSHGDINLPLFEMKLKNIVLNLASFHMRTSFDALINHYDQKGCEWEPVLEECPVGIVYNFVAESSNKLTVTAVSGLCFVVAPSILETVNHTVTLWDNAKTSDLLHTYSTDTSSFSADPHHKYPTRIDNTLPCSIQYSHGKKGGILSLDAMCKASSLSTSSIAICTPFDNATYTVDTSRLGVTELSCGIVADLKLANGVKVISIKTSVTIQNGLQVPIRLGDLGTVPVGGCLSVPDHMLDKRMKVFHHSDAEAALPSLPYSELVHNCLTRGGSIEVPLRTPEADHFFVVKVDRDDTTDRTELRICPPFSVTNLTGRPLCITFTSDVAGAEMISSTILETSHSVHLTTVDPTEPLYMSTSLTQPGGEQLKTLKPSCIKSQHEAEPQLVSSKLVDRTGATLPVWVETTYLSSREAHLTARFWIVNHTFFNLTLVCDGVPVELPGKADSPVLVSPQPANAKQELEVRLMVRGREPASGVIPLHILGAEGLAYINDSEKEGHGVAIAYRTGFSGGEQGYRTRVVELLPRWVVLNKTGFALQMATSSGVVELPPNEPVPYHMQQLMQAKQSVSFSAGGEQSCAVCLNQIGDVVLHVLNEYGVKIHVKVSIKEETTLYVVVSPTVAPFSVVNRTPCLLKVWQTGHDASAVEVKQRETAKLCWEDISGKQTVQFEVLGTVTEPVDVFGLGGCSDPVLSTAAVDVYCHLSPTRDDRVLELIVYTDPLMREQVLKLNANQSEDVLTVKVDVKHLSVSLVREEERKEVACLTLHGLFTQICRGNGQEMIQLSLHHLQLDDMTESQPLFPVVLSISEPHKPKPAVDVTTLRRLNNTNLLHFQHIGLYISPIKVSIGDRFLWEFFEFKREAKVALGMKYAMVTSYSTEHYMEKCVVESGMLARRIHFDNLRLPEICITLTVDRLKEGRDPYRDGLGLGNLALALPSVKDSEVTLDAINVQHGRDNVGMLLHRLALNYVRQFEASHNIAGMALRIQAIGNPLGLISNITTGVRDFVVMPAVGLSQSPVEFGAGILRGTGSLLGKSVGGILGTVAGVTRGSARAIESVADQDWRNRRSVDAKAEKQNPLETAVKGVFDGVVGLVKDPVVGAMTGGAMGGLKGAGRGLVGAVAKPVSGVLNGVSDTASFIEKTVMLKAPLARVRHPKYYDPERQSAGIVWKETYENQRWYVGVSWSNTLLPFIDYPRWSDVKGNKSPEKTAIELPRGMVWASPWTTDVVNGGKDGWLYAVDFKSAFHMHRHELDFVRRRRWLRAMRPAADAPDLPMHEGSPRAGQKSSFIALEKRCAKKLQLVMKPVAGSVKEDRVGASPQVAFITIDVSENQKYLPGIGWSPELGLMDCWKWSDKTGREQRANKANTKPPAGYMWCSEWENEEGGEGGWWYSDYSDGTYTPEMQPGSTFRRRHWRRRARIVV
eukprot:TRINITY_DN6762_c0_g1_i4.p1 TRINITY_DN6762_c0_g1~~TRINITY_DN6762_c0_g1_i4.p1  ORF type:complete len:2967 (+),score=837.61 TRINITY_DN6762_c0_g1_i4:855-9755(+)